MHIDCTIEQRDDVVVMTPFGEVDRDTAPELRARLSEAVGLAGTGIVDVDLRHVTFMDSSGIGALLAGHRLAGDHGARLQVHSPRQASR